jgi:hypothetical protein
MIRTTWMRRRRATPRRSDRERNPEFMEFVRRQPCSVRVDPPDPNRITPCSGRVEADHMGDRAMGRKADDDTCAPMCHAHHVQRSSHHGSFRDLMKPELREWRARQIERTQAAWRAR